MKDLSTEEVRALAYELAEMYRVIGSAQLLEYAKLAMDEYENRTIEELGGSDDE
jgi:hypothetical protein